MIGVIVLLGVVGGCWAVVDCWIRRQNRDARGYDILSALDGRTQTRRIGDSLHYNPTTGRWEA